MQNTPTLINYIQFVIVESLSKYKISLHLQSLLGIMINHAVYIISWDTFKESEYGRINISSIKINTGGTHNEDDIYSKNNGIMIDRPNLQATY